MYTLLRKHRSLLVSLALMGMALAIGYIAFQFSRLPLFAKTANMLAEPWVLPGLLAILLVTVAVVRRNLVLGFLLYMAGFYVIADLVKVLFLIIGRNNPVAQAFQMIHMGGLFPILLAGLCCLWGYINVKRIRVTNYQVPVANLAGGNLRIAMISDMHLGAVLREEDLSEVVEKINRAKADVVVFGGDIFEESTTKAQLHAAMEAFSHIEAPQGVYYVPGNHEYAAQRQGTLNVDDVARRFACRGITTLRDQGLLVDERLYLIGREEKETGDRAALGDLVAENDQNLPLVVVDHHPTELQEAHNLGVDLHLSGHTHGGQLFRIRKMGERFGHSDMMYGKRSIGGFHAIVSSGVGAWRFPMRIGSPSEVVVVDLVAEK